MNTPLNNQRNNTLYFIGAIALSAALMAASGFFATRMLSGNAGSISSAAKACGAVMRTNGFDPKTKKDGSISGALSTTQNIEGLTYKIGVIMASCPSYTLYDFCAGAGCPNPGVSFTLNPKEL